VLIGLSERLPGGLHVQRHGAREAANADDPAEIHKVIGDARAEEGIV